jgi:hypothetical protein
VELNLDLAQFGDLLHGLQVLEVPRVLRRTVRLGRRLGSPASGAHRVGDWRREGRAQMISDSCDHGFAVSGATASDVAASLMAVLASLATTPGTESVLLSLEQPVAPTLSVAVAMSADNIHLARLAWSG